MSEPGELTHLDERGRARMVDVSDKAPTLRRAAASARVHLGREVFNRVMAGSIEKGDVFAVARVAGLQAAKRTPELIPLCHGLSPEHIDVQVETQPPDALLIRAEVCVHARTGVEMEALVAASVAALTVYDMCKALSRQITIGPVRLEHKSGGRSGTWSRSADG